MSWKTDPSAKNTAEDMICTLAGMCNYASSWDGAGFSKIDAEFGHSLARQASEGKAWTVKQATAALKLLRKYQRQLGGKNYMDEWLTSPIFRKEPRDPSVKPQNDEKKQNDRQLRSRDSLAVFSFGYDTEIVAGIKNIKGEHKGKKFWASWDPSNRSWTIPVNETSIWPIIDLARKFSFDIEDRFEEYVTKVKEKTEESRVMLSLNGGQHITVANDTIIVSVEDAAILEEFEKILLGDKNG